MGDVASQEEGRLNELDKLALAKVQRERLAQLLRRHVNEKDSDLTDRRFVWRVMERFFNGMEEPIIFPGD